jgi:hypothetical protein
MRKWPGMPDVICAAFDRCIGIDYSGAQTPTSSLLGLRIYVADRASDPVEEVPPRGSRKYWTRRGIAEWLVAQVSDHEPLIVGIDHAFSFPLAYFQEYALPLHWSGFLDDFQGHWPTDGDHIRVDFVRNGTCGNGAARTGNPRWRRLTELRARTAKSVFHFDVPGSVAKSTHGGLLWLCYIRQKMNDRVHFWPFDGWTIPSGRSVIAEVYPSLWRHSFPPEKRNDHQHDAYSVAAWMRRADLDGSLPGVFDPPMSTDQSSAAETEGWILGVK